ncbi:hypothetical protein ANAEL_02445 [Anaerolineales bacterium]|nr:hypothetical protein ANAEL_02445 [Anaerolineales bacterium]
MRKATKTVAMWFGVTAGIAGLEHGYFEILQGNTRPMALAFPSWGPQQCDPTKIWHACEPAMSILPNFLVTGILAMLLSLAIIIWAGWFVQRKQGGLILVLLSIALLLFGGGFFPPIIALVGGLAGTKINKPLSKQPGSITRLAAKLWPWPLAIFLTWVLGQFPFGYFFNDFLKSIMYFGMLLILTSLPLSVYTAYAHDAVEQSR